LLPGALGDAASARADSFMDGLLDFPHYTRPDEIHGQRVPEVLLGGNHADIRRWRHKQALGRTWQRRPDLLQAKTLDAEQQKLLDEFIEELEQNSGIAAKASTPDTED
jgi:tRNA (guanine37-N1)-methyltransferase